MRAGPHHCLLVMSQEKEPLFRLVCVTASVIRGCSQCSDSPSQVLALCLLSLGAPQPMGVTGLAVSPPPPRQCWAQKPLYSWRDVIRVPLLVVGLQDLHLHCYGVWPGPLAQGPRVSELGIHFSPPAEAGLAKLNGSP